MNRLLVFCVLFVLIGAYVLHQVTHLSLGAKPAEQAASEQTWRTDFSAAKTQAASENKKLLLDFTGSDWCPQCKRLEAEVLKTDAFRNFAKDYILIRLDFPRSTELPPALKQQNRALEKQFQVWGYPTLIALDSSGREITRQVGYEPGSGPREYLAGFKK
ncbi:MAG TPA: thioredoxin family protein [Opitutaceae bacterium]|nr:thioredoxin family protein [Opitutaceae bacterium]